MSQTLLMYEQQAKSQSTFQVRGVVSGCQLPNVGVDWDCCMLVQGEKANTCCYLHTQITRIVDIEE